MKCSRCNRDAIPGKSRCQHHLDLHAAQSLRRRNRRLENNLCIVCGKVPPRDNEKRCDKCSKKFAEYLKQERSSQSKSGLCPYCHGPNDTSTSRCSNCIRKRKAAAERLKREVLIAYGGIKCSCPKCNEKSNDIRFLTIDHIDNDGYRHRKKLGSGGSTLYRWLKKNNFPPGYRVLCFNCNSARHLNGGICPHMTNTESVAND